MESYYEMMFSKHSEIVVERYWDMERYDADDCLHETREEFFEYVKENAFHSLLFFKFKNTQEINEYMEQMWEEKKEHSKEENKEVDVDLDSEPFCRDEDWDMEFHVKQILKSQQDYEERHFAEKLEESIKEMKNKGEEITNKKKHYLTQLKTHPLYDLIVFMCWGNLKAIHWEIDRYWKGN